MQLTGVSDKVPKQDARGDRQQGSGLGGSRGLERLAGRKGGSLAGGRSPSGGGSQAVMEPQEDFSAESQHVVSPDLALGGGIHTNRLAHGANVPSPEPLPFANGKVKAGAAVGRARGGKRKRA